MSPDPGGCLHTLLSRIHRSGTATRSLRTAAIGLGLATALAGGSVAASGPLLAAPADTSPAVFLDRTRTAGIGYRNVTGTPQKTYIVETIGPGAGWLDYDVDGRIDLYVTDGAPLERLDDGRLRPGPGRPNVLYRNVDGARFEAADAGVEDRGWGGGCAVADFDNDGFPDIYVTNLGRNVLYRNLGDGTFAEMRDAGADEPRWSTSAAFADLDGDGFVDLYVANYVEFDWDRPPLPGSSPNCSFLGVPVMCGPRGLAGAPDRLLRNDRGLRLVPWQEESVGRPRLYGLGVSPLDADLDGDTDLYVANDSVPNLLWRNDGGSLVEAGLEAGVAVSGDGQEQAGMGVATADADGDGAPDLFVTNFSHDRNTFYENLGAGRFVDSTYRRGLAAASQPALGWAAEFSDVDGDGDLDLLTFNGHVYPQIDEHDLGSSYLQPPQLFVNDGSGHFRPHEPLVDGAPAPAWSSRAAAFGDYDDDGDDDVFVVNLDSAPALLENAGGPGPGSWLRVRLVGRAASRDAAGARVTLVTEDGERRARWVSRAGSFQSSDDPRLGLAVRRPDGTVACAAAGCALEILWPGGDAERVEELHPGTSIVIVQGRGVVATEALRSTSRGTVRGTSRGPLRGTLPETLRGTGTSVGPASEQ